MSTTYESINTLMTWFRQAPRTRGFDAVMAFDRNQTNRVLLQEYIKRFGKADYVQPITKVTRLTNAIQQFVGYRFDMPRVSFENASLDKGELTMTLRSVGGMYLLWSGASLATAALVRIDKLAPFASHTYTATVELKDNPLEVNGRRVVLDIRTGNNPRLDSTEIPQEQALAGVDIQQRFREMTADQTTFELSKVSYGASDLIQPETIRIRTQPAPGATRAASDNYGDGAVLVFVGMKNGNVGSPPGKGDTTWKYLLQPGSHSALLVLSHEFIMGKITGQGFKTLKNTYGAAVKGNMAVVMENEGTAGFKRVMVQHSNYLDLAGPAGFPRHRPDYGYAFKLPYTVNERNPIEGRWGVMYLNVKNNRLEGNWQCHETLIEASFYASPNHRGATWSDKDFEFRWHYNAVVKDNSVSFEPIVDAFPTFSWAKEQSDDYFRTAAGDCEDYIRIHFLPTHANAFLNAMKLVNTAHLSNLLFNSEVPLALKGAQVPGDMVIYGDVNPELTSFVVSPSEPSVMIGTSLPFTWSGSTKPTFTLEWADGEGNNRGSIDANGKYTAPASLPAGRDFVRVRVVAKAGKATSYALVTVAAVGVSANPVVQMVRAGFKAQPLRGMAIDGGALTWRSKLGGSVVEGVDLNGQRVYNYTPPASYEGNAAVDELTVTSGPYSGKCYVVNIKQENYILQIDRAGSTLAQRKVRVNFGLAPQAADDNGWAVLAGGGTIAASEAEFMVYQAPATPALPFAVVELSEFHRGAWKYAYVMIPQPVDVLAQTV